MMTYIKHIPVLIFLLLTAAPGQAQSPSTPQAEKLFKGIWVDKKTTRHLEISFENGYATIIDWTSKLQKRESGDIYKAFLRNGKLVMPEDTEFHAPYSEIISKNNTLIYLTKPIITKKTSRWDKQIFTRSSKL
ncbi:hypothetical protein LPB86_12200 [Pedobacter sp. MC2016-14]|uniref:hypothetical protein n=1 Tax=Pedobacter sp. MC2016-14 TaxID=2897327 RepID=UPI001E4A8FCA|nr:hypothetical protein [Pedobacter sp. MC2016-14]MCD0488992.1 hypothetical protein [Pedobacter sp. MC2016-14]